MKTYDNSRSSADGCFAAIGVLACYAIAGYLASIGLVAIYGGPWTWVSMAWGMLAVFVCAFFIALLRWWLK